MQKIDLASVSLNHLLQHRVKDLNIQIPTKYQHQINLFYQLLKEKSINWRPHFWLSDEWFSPDGVAGIAIPFVLCHPKLIVLERRFLGECEGSTQKDFFKLLCHEAGHALDNAYGLRRKKKRQEIFGLSSKPYPNSYTPNPLSKDYVTHLGDFYAQAHPDEDWAETFAVWLQTKNWKQKYAGTKALRKLCYIDQVMQELSKTKQIKTYKTTVHHYKKDDRTIENYLTDKQKQLNKTQYSLFQSSLSKQFNRGKGATAYTFIKKTEKELLRQKHNLKDKWIMSRCLKEIKEECKKQRYSLKYSERYTKINLKRLVESEITHFIKQGRTKVYM